MYALPKTVITRFFGLSKAIGIKTLFLKQMETWYKSKGIKIPPKELTGEDHRTMKDGECLSCDETVNVVN